MPPSWQAELVVDADLARQLVHEQFPELPLADLSPFGSGWDNTAWLADGIVFRFPRRAIAAEFMRSELLVLPLMQDFDIAVPFPEWVGQSTARFPWPFSGYRVLPGRTACRVHPNPEDRVALASALGRFFRRLHNLPPPEGLPGDVIKRLDGDRLEKGLHENLPRLRQHGLIDAVEPWLETVRYGASVARRIAPEQRLVHGDVYVRHLLLEPADTLVGIIDWGDAHIGHRAVDFAVAHSFLPPHAHRAFFEAYGEVDADSWALARFRALHHTAYLADYAVTMEDADLIEECRIALAHLAHYNGRP